MNEKKNIDPTNNIEPPFPPGDESIISGNPKLCNNNQTESNINPQSDECNIEQTKDVPIAVNLPGSDKKNVKDFENDVEKMVNVASIIEKEARVDEDRPLIASVIYNRINQNMPLQIDATVIYAHGYYIESVRNRHLAIESKYNTYLYKGLPVGPICNPGIESLKAALNPASTDYLFYLLAGENKHYFTKNYNDFLKKKEELGY